jgi:uncharacterized protein (UPF0332 family)
MFNVIASTYTTNFDDLIKLVPEDKLESYSQEIANQFDELFKTGDNLTYYKWTIRCFRSCRHILSSALFYEQSDYLLKRSMPNLIYYLLYYSWFHSVCSILCLSPKISFSNMKNIRHGDALKLIKNNFVDTGILDTNFASLHNELLMYRESFSYQIPLGGGIGSRESIPRPRDIFDRVSAFQPALIQLSSLQSYCAHEIAEKYSVSYDIDDFYEKNQTECDQLFFECINNADRLGHHLIIDDNDYRILGWVLSCYKGPYPVDAIIFEKFYDELAGHWFDGEQKDPFEMRQVLYRIGKWIG